MQNLRLVASNGINLEQEPENQFVIATLDISSFHFADFIGNLQDENLIGTKFNDINKTILPYCQKPAYVIRDIYLQSPTVAFMAYDIPLKASCWRAYCPFQFQAMCAHCDRPITFDLWTLKDFMMPSQVLTRNLPLVDYCKKILTTQPKKAPWCQPCIEKALALLTEPKNDKSPWHLLQENVFSLLKERLNDMDLRYDPECAVLSKSLNFLFNQLSYTQLSYTIIQVTGNIKNNIETKRYGRRKAQSELPIYLMNYGKACLKNNYRIQCSQIPLDETTKSHLFQVNGFNPVNLATVPFNHLVQKYSNV